jgi:hypothetical protein
VVGIDKGQKVRFTDRPAASDFLATVTVIKRRIEIVFDVVKLGFKGVFKPVLDRLMQGALITFEG